MDFKTLVRECIKEMVAEALAEMGEWELPNAPERVSPGANRPAQSAARPAVEAPRVEPEAPRKVDGAGRAGDKQTYGLLQQIVDVLAVSPQGMRAEHLRARLGIEKKALVKAIALGLERGEIRRTGAKRTTTYHAS